jgi:hypothetical protein
LIFVKAKDGFWDPASYGPAWQRVGRAPSGAHNIDVDVHMLTTGFLTMFDTAIPGGTRMWEIRSNFTRNLQVGQSATVVTGGNLGYVDVTMNRTNIAPVGVIWAWVYAQDGNGYPTGLPLATSTARNASAVSTAGNGAPFRFTFPAGQQPLLTVGQGVVVVVAGNYPINGLHFVRVHYGIGYSSGYMYLYGTGVGLDDQSYPLIQDMESAVPNASGTFTVWTTPNMTAGVEYDSENFSGALQNYVRGGTYAEGDPIHVSLIRSPIFFPAGDVHRTWAQYGHPTYTTPTRLIVEWRKRNSQVI